MLLHDTKTDISIGSVPPFLKRRKKPMLGVKQGNRLRYVATFRSNADEQWFMDKFRQFLHIKELEHVGRKWLPEKDSKSKDKDEEQTANENTMEETVNQEEYDPADDIPAEDDMENILDSPEADRPLPWNVQEENTDQ